MDARLPTIEQKHIGVEVCHLMLNGKQEQEQGPGINFKGTRSVTCFLLSDGSFKDSATSQGSTAPLGTRHPTTHKPVEDISQSNHDQQCPDMRSSCPGRACWRLGLGTSTDGEYS